jgi:hypothetical protein
MGDTVGIEHISVEFVQWLDREVGRTIERNGGYAEVAFRMIQGRLTLLKFETSFTQEQLQRDLAIE